MEWKQRKNQAGENATRMVVIASPIFGPNEHNPKYKILKYQFKY